MEESSALITTLGVISLFFIAMFLLVIFSIIDRNERVVVSDSERKQIERDKELGELNKYLEELYKYE